MQVERARHAGGDDLPRSAGSEYRARSGADCRAWARQPAAHQDPQDPGDRQDADGGGRRRHHLPEARRGGESSSMPASTDDILLTYNIVGKAKTDRLMALSSRVKRLAVVADNETVVRGLSEAGVRHGRDVPILIECDTGFGRNGVQSPEAALEPGRYAMNLPRIRFEGLMTYPNKAPGTARIPVTRDRALRGGRDSRPGRLRRRNAGAPDARRFPDDDRAPRRHLRLQRRDDGASSGAPAGTIAPCTCGHRGERADGGPRRHRRRLEGAHSRAVLREGFRPRRRISRRGRGQRVGGARHRSTSRARRASRRSAR